MIHEESIWRENSGGSLFFLYDVKSRMGAYLHWLLSVSKDIVIIYSFGGRHLLFPVRA